MRNIDLKMAEINKKFKAQIINQGTDIIEVAKYHLVHLQLTG